MWINSPELQRNFDSNISPDLWRNMDYLSALLPPDLMDTVRDRVNQIVQERPESADYVSAQLSRLWFSLANENDIVEDKLKWVYLKAANDNYDISLDTAA